MWFGFTGRGVRRCGQLGGNHDASLSCGMITKNIADNLPHMASKLNDWATLAARAYGTYAGVNTAIAKATDKSSPAVQHADEVRQQVALMAVIRTFAVLDRDGSVSFQPVYQFPKEDRATELISALYAASEPPCSNEMAMADCGKAIERFQAEYQRINWKAFGRLQGFRNSAISHVAWGDVKKFVTYGELEETVRICCRLAGELTLMTSGLNDWPEEDISEYQETAYTFWAAAFAAGLRGRPAE
ncbi:hypothetical protein [Nitratireductor sp. GCM10026969]|uniref:hypothetical protein n=1 Tax=Nitratireductor sp. GCM10026969 TaxID=3252645 RepID=UPI003617F333